MDTTTIGTRLKALREERKLSQDDLARAFGFKDRQTVSAIETGERRVSAEELVRAAQVFGVEIDYFTDPFLLAGEGRFSWRQSGLLGGKLADYEVDAGRFIAAYRTLAPQVGRPGPLLRPTLELTRHSRFEDAAATAERFAAELELGDVPAVRLAGVMEGKLGILVLMVDAIPGVSGAACRLPELDVVLINRREVPGRRHFDLAHELFHILTWKEMPPEHVEDVEPKTRNRVEQLADSFAAALLMPAPVLARFGDWSDLTGDKLVRRLTTVADELGVTASALRWRLVALDRLDKVAAKAIPEAKLRHNGRTRTAKGPAKETPPTLFSKAFVEVIARAVDEGRVAVRRVSHLLGLSIDEIAELFETHGVAPPYEL